MGCIPKKLFHIAAQTKENYKDAESFGWIPEKEQNPHDWTILKDGIQKYIKQINFGYSSKIKDLGIDFINAKAVFKDAQTVEFDFKNVFSGSS